MKCFFCPIDSFFKKIFFKPISYVKKYLCLTENFSLFQNKRCLQATVFCAIVLTLCSVEKMNSFEVKVLLKKYKDAELEQNPISIHSAHGFIISFHPALAIGSLYSDKNLLVDFRNQSLFIQDQAIQMPCYVFPMLSAKHKELLLHFVQNWLETHHDCLREQVKILQSFFDSFFDKNDIVPSDSNVELNNYAHDVFMSFLFDFMKQLGDKEPVVSLQTLEQYVDYFLQKNLSESFFNQLHILKISKKDRKLLQQDISFRYDFLGKQVLILMSKLLQEFIVILPRHFLAQVLHEEVGCLTWNGTNYLGSFVFVQEPNTIYLVNNLDIDDYLLSVVRHEGWPGWPLEMNKVLAITCRTYLVWQVLQAQKSKRPYHIENGIRHQSYKGHHKFARLKQAVEETRDICIGHDNKPILAMFDGCCGGIIPAHIDHPDYQKHPYLLRTEKCTFCKDFKVASWKSIFSHDQMVEALQKTIPELTTIDTMSVTKKDNAGLVTDVSITTPSSMVQLTPSTIFHLTGKKMYSIFPEVISFSFDIETLPKKLPVKHKSKHQKKGKQVPVQNNILSEKQFVISGKGYGHHIGLCQWGAMKLVRDYHWNYQKVLQFYYPGTNLIKLTYQR